VGLFSQLSASLFGLSLYSCLFKYVVNQAKRSAHTHKGILEPCEAMVAGLITDDVQVTAEQRRWQM